MEERRTRSVFGCILEKPLTSELKSSHKEKSVLSGEIMINHNVRSDSMGSRGSSKEIIASENSRLWADYYSNQRGGTSNERAQPRIFEKPPTFREIDKMSSRVRPAASKIPSMNRRAS
jgi:hypothetical protein